MPTLEPPAGQFDSGAFVFPVRVYYEDTDAFGIVYYANYLKFAERARTEMLRAFGTDHVRLRREVDRVFAVRRCVVDYRAPARLEDALLVATRVLRVAGASFALGQEIRRGNDVLVDVEVVLACISGSGRPARVPEALRAALAAIVCENER
jgi:acyl-CoA thioester hydrolase